MKCIEFEKTDALDSFLHDTYLDAKQVIKKTEVFHKMSIAELILKLAFLFLSFGYVTKT